MSRSGAGALVSVVLCVLAAESSHAQQIQEQITVDLVEVPVHVVRRGKAVEGLTREVFELYVNGKRHPFEYFDVIDSRGALPAIDESATSEPQPPSDAAPLERRNLTVLLFDTVATSHRYLLRASEAAQKFISDAPPTETFAVARLNPDGVQFLMPFTDDRFSALRAARTLRPSAAGDVLALATLESERSIALTEAAPGSLEALDDAALDGLAAGQIIRAEVARDDGTTPDSGPASMDAIARFNENIRTMGRADSELRTAQHLSALADKLAPIAGIKHVIFFAQGGRRVADPNSAARMHERFRAAGVILDAVEIGEGMRVPAMTTAESRTDGSLWAAPSSRYPEDRSEPLYTLALGTGGTVTKNFDINDGLRLLREIQGVTYVLGFRPPPSDRIHNDIKVKVRDQRLGTSVTYRRGYSTRGRPAQESGLFLADVMLNDIPQRGLTVGLTAEPRPEGTRVVVRVPGHELLARQAMGPETTVDVFLYVFNEREAVAAWAYWRLKLDLEKGRDFLAGNAYEMQRLFNLRPGKFSAKALLRFVDSDVTGFQRTDFRL